MPDLPHVVRTRTLPEGLRDPVLIAAFEGWNDAGEAASGAVKAFMESVRATQFADLDPEEFYDFQVNRPMIRWDGDVRTLDWPGCRLSHASLDGPRDAVLVAGVEPNMRWRTFTTAILDVATAVGCRRVVTLGALQVDLPHTRPVPLTGSAGNISGAGAEGLRRSSYEGPTGIVGVLHQAAIRRGLEAVTLWVGVPHYLAATTYRRAALRLAQRASPLMGLSGALEDLAREAAEQAEDIDELVAEDRDLADYIDELERRSDVEDELVWGDDVLPEVSGEQLAADFERYLRDRGEGDPGG